MVSGSGCELYKVCKKSLRVWKNLYEIILLFCFGFDMYHSRGAEEIELIYSCTQCVHNLPF